MSKEIAHHQAEAVLTDVDCTLLNSRRQLSNLSLATIEHYLREQQNNHNLPRLALCTARHPAALINTVLPVFTKNAPDSVHIVCDGAMLIDAQAKVISQEAFSSAIIKQICQDVESLGGSFSFGFQDAFYCGEDFLRERSQGAELIKFLPYSAIAEHDDWTTTLIIINHLNEAVEKYTQSLQNEFNFHLSKLVSTFNHQAYYNLTLPNISKVKGVEKWLEHYQLSSDKLIMIGDGMNDLEVMANSIGVAVANAQPEVKEQARLILDKSNDEDAVAWFLNEILSLSVPT
ncbi:MAG: HAD-IIB family hydrolase [Candidatus Pacebacteria bacterium]|nr:HAD-IIB family hydrolase [Candidatus Paceibacterota bacterium]